MTGRVQTIAKRSVDICGALFTLILAAPLLIPICMYVRTSLGTPVFFIQERAGRHGKSFRMIKFRTMSEDRDLSGRLLPDAERLVPFGRFLRVTSLDELPELLNVLKGEMSIVGPRPLLIEYLPLYSPMQARRHAVRPGITGWAQVNGRNAVTWEQKLAMDVWYVDNQTFLLDLKIVWRTLITVLSRRGINQNGHATMEKFTGS